MKILAAVVISAIFSTSVFAFSGWKGFSDPQIMSSGFTHQYSVLPLEGSIDIGPRGWSGHFWASNEGGINYRWNSPKKEKFGFKSPSRSQVASMSLAELATLSPAEKFDLFTGHYDYPLKQEAEGNSSRFAKDWAGICHGWAPASVLHDEPTPKVKVNPQGIRIPFGSGDIKALLSYYYAFYHESDTNQIGLRCYFGRWSGGIRGCGDDLNAGAFHIIMANQLGLKKEAFLMDADRTKEVWNHAVVSYKSVVTGTKGPSAGAAASTVQEIIVETELYFVSDSKPQWNVVHGTEHQILDKKELEYRLELNRDGKIVGGEWISWDRPDFLWNKSRATEFKGAFSSLSQLLDD